MFGRKKRSLSDFDSEIQAHIDFEAEELRKDGLGEEEAHYAALRQFGNVTIARERFYEAGRWLWLDALFRDLRFAFRIFSKQPGTSLAIIGTLALAIGITTAVFSPVNALLFTNLPYRDPDRLVAISGIGGADSEKMASFKQQTPFFEDIAGYSVTGANLLGAGEPVAVTIAQVTANFPKVMGTVPKAGRTFSANEQTNVRNEKLSEFNSVALISERLWSAKFSSDVDICGKPVILNDRPFTIIGVLPAEFDYPLGAQVWTPTFHSALELSRSGVTFWSTIARIRHPLSFSQAARQYMAILYPENSARPPDTEMIGNVRYTRSPDIEQLKTSLAKAGGKDAWLLFGSACFVMLIAVINVIGLVMARILSRQREFAIRHAVGASRISLLRQLLVEHTFLAVAGGAAGLLIAFPGVRLMKTLLPANWPSYAEIGVDSRLLLFTLTLSIVVGIFSGIAAAFSILQTRRFLDARQTGEQTGVPGRILKWRSALIFVETALALTLLSGSGLLMKNFLDKLNADLGFNPENLLMLTVTRDTKDENSSAQTRDFYFRALDNLRTIPQVKSVSGTSVAIMNPRSLMFLNITTDATNDIAETRNSAGYMPYSIAPGFFKTVGTRFLAGRDFNDMDTASSEKVIIINDALARKLRLDEQSLGTRVTSIIIRLVGTWWAW